MSDTLTPEHTSWLDGLFGGGADPAPQAPAPSQASPAPAQSNAGPSALGTDETGRDVPPDEAFGGTTPTPPSATSAAAPSAAPVPAAATAAAGEATGGEQAGSEPSLWNRVAAAAVTDPVLGVPKVIGGAFVDYLNECDRKEADEERGRAEAQERVEAQRKLAQTNTKEHGDEYVRRREAAEEDAANKRWEKIMQAERDREAEAAAQAEYQRDKASRDRDTQDYMTRQEKKHQQVAP